MSMKQAFDALGDVIVLGKLYGYSRSEGGRSTTVIGRALKISDAGKVRLAEVKRRNYLYGEEYAKTWAESAEEVSINAFMVFPI